jgi:hypothetical protein
MAIYNEILAPRFERFLAKLLNMKGGAHSPQLAGEWSPGFAMQMDGAELRYLLDWKRFGQTSTVTGGVGQTSKALWRNPAGSNIVAVFESVRLITFGAGQALLAYAPNNPANLAATESLAFRVDQRMTGAGSGSLLFSRAAVAGPTATNIMQISVAVAETRDFIATVQQELPLLPGDALMLDGNQANTNLTFSALWRERLMEESERS